MKIIRSNTMSNIYLIQNISTDQNLVENFIKEYIQNNPPTDLTKRPTLHFFKYTTNENSSGFENKGTSYFMDNLPDSGGFSSEDLDNYADEKIAAYSISKCSSDPNSFIGTLYFYGLEGLDLGFEKKEILLNECTK